MSQKNDMWQERSGGEAKEKVGGGTEEQVALVQLPPGSRLSVPDDLAGSSPSALPVQKEAPNEAITPAALSDSNETDSSEAGAAGIEGVAKSSRSHANLEYLLQQLSGGDDSVSVDAMAEESGDGSSNSGGPPSRRFFQQLADWRVTLRFHRADLYVGIAVFLALIALLWPAASAPKRAALSPLDRALVALGVAEASVPTPHFRGDPTVQVWVDPHTALYYCPGEEQYGKTADGRVSTQRDAQNDRFEPAGRSACE